MKATVYNDRETSTLAEFVLALNDAMHATAEGVPFGRIELLARIPDGMRDECLQYVEKRRESMREFGFDAAVCMSDGGRYLGFAYWHESAAVGVA